MKQIVNKQELEELLIANPNNIAMINMENEDVIEIDIVTKEEEKELLLISIRKARDILLRESDKYLISDYPISESKKYEYKTYRQSLRDFPSTIDLSKIETLNMIKFPEVPTLDE